MKNFPFFQEKIQPVVTAIKNHVQEIDFNGYHSIGSFADGMGQRIREQEPVWQKSNKIGNKNS